MLKYFSTKVFTFQNVNRILAILDNDCLIKTYIYYKNVQNDITKDEKVKVYKRFLLLFITHKNVSCLSASINKLDMADFPSIRMNLNVGLIWPALGFILQFHLF